MKQFLLAVIFSLCTIQTAFAVVNLNTASKAELESLTGIGPSKAQAILDYRKKSGGFKSIDELENVPGIGPAILAKIKKEISVGGVTKVAETVTDKTANKPTTPKKPNLP